MSLNIKIIHYYHLIYPPQHHRQHYHDHRHLKMKQVRLANLSSLEKEAISYGKDVASDDGQRDSREDVGVVALARMEHLPLVGHGVERTAARKHAPSLSVVNELQKSRRCSEFSIESEVRFVFKNYEF